MRLDIFFLGRTEMRSKVIPFLEDIFLGLDQRTAIVYNGGWVAWKRWQALKFFVVGFARTLDEYRFSEFSILLRFLGGRFRRFGWRFKLARFGLVFNDFKGLFGSRFGLSRLFFLDYSRWLSWLILDCLRLNIHLRLI